MLNIYVISLPDKNYDAYLLFEDIEAGRIT